MSRIIIMLLVLTSSLLAQKTDSTLSKYGFVIEISHFTIEQFGMRYRLSESSQILLTTNGGIFNEGDNVEKDLLVSSIYELQIYKREEAELFLSAGMRFRTNHRVYVYKQGSQNGVTTSIYGSTNMNELSGVLGLGASYQLSKGLVLFCHQNLEISKSHITENNITSISRDYSSIDIVESRFGLTIYL